MQLHRGLASLAMSSTDYTCPVCGMSTLDSGYDNENYVTMMHGQKVYSCGMAARPFPAYSSDLTDTAYLGANMAEFIINQTDVDAYAKCTSACNECVDGIRPCVWSCCQDGQLRLRVSEERSEDLLFVTSEQELVPYKRQQGAALSG